MTNHIDRILRSTPLTATTLLSVGLALAASSNVACSQSKRAESGSIILVLQTDMQLPKDLDTVTLQVKQDDEPIYEENFSVGPDGVHLPGTLALYKTHGGTSAAQVRVIGWSGREAKVVRELVTTIPTGRNAMLNVPISWLCWDSATNQGDNPDKNPDLVGSICEEGSTCQAGQCKPVTVDEQSLPDFVSEDVFGGASNADDGGACFDTVTCFSTGWSVGLNMQTCSFVKPQNIESLSVAVLKKKGTTGICGPQACLIPLDAESSEGWQVTDDGASIKLPPIVCSRIQSDPDTLGVALTTSCAPKTEKLPTCGPWSSANRTPGNFDAPGPDAGTSDATLDVVEEPTPDVVEEPDTGPACPEGDGTYCGNDSPGTDNDLYTCKAGSYSLETKCGVLGCEKLGGGNDACHPPIKQLAAGENFTCALRTDGRVKCFGTNIRGELGNGQDQNSNIPVPTSTSPGTAQIAAGFRTACAVYDQGKLECWGGNGEYLLGMNGTNAVSRKPVQIANDNVRKVALYTKTACYIGISKGQVFCWGRNTYGQLGNGTNADTQAPVQVSSIVDAVDVAVSNSSVCAVDKPGHTLCWGNNLKHELGFDGPDSNLPMLVQGVGSAISVTAGSEFFCMLDTNSDVWCWGENNYGQMGIGSKSATGLLPVKVHLSLPADQKVTAVEAGPYTTCALTDAGTVWCWGANFDNATGKDGAYEQYVLTPIQVNNIPKVTSLSLGGTHTHALLEDGTALGWGHNYYGELGIGKNSDAETTPQKLIQP